MTNDTTTVTALPKPDLSASLVTEQDGKKVWNNLFAVNRVKDGYYKGKNNEGKTIIVETKEAKYIQRSLAVNDKVPDLFVYRDENMEGDTVWAEILVAWKGKKDGVFTTKTHEGHSVVIQTAEARSAAFKQPKHKTVAPVNLSAEFETEPDTQS